MKAATRTQYVPYTAFSHEVTLLAYWNRLRLEHPPGRSCPSTSILTS